MDKHLSHSIWYGNYKIWIKHLWYTYICISGFIFANKPFQFLFNSSILDTSFSGLEPSIDKRFLASYSRLSLVAWKNQDVLRKWSVTWWWCNQRDTTDNQEYNAIPGPGPEKLVSEIARLKIVKNPKNWRMKVTWK